MLLLRCYQQSLERAIEIQAKTIAFPAISTGAYGYPLQEATDIATSAVKGILEKYPADVLRKIYFVCYHDATYQEYEHNLYKFTD